MDLPTSKENRSPTVIAVVVVCQVLSVFVVALRLWTRGVIVRAVGADDYLAIISLVGKTCPNLNSFANAETGDSSAVCSWMRIFQYQPYVASEPCACRASPLIIVETNYGLGRHVTTLKEGELLLYLRVSSNHSIFRKLTLRVSRTFTSLLSCTRVQ